MYQIYYFKNFDAVPKQFVTYFFTISFTIIIMRIFANFVFTVTNMLEGMVLRKMTVNLKLLKNIKFLFNLYVNCINQIVSD